MVLSLCHDTHVPVMVNISKAMLKGSEIFFQSALSNAKYEIHYQNADYFRKLPGLFLRQAVLGRMASHQI